MNATEETQAIVGAYADYNRANMVRQAIAGIPINPPSADELFQFYQVYVVTKDTQFHNRVSRPLNVQLSVVELSIIFLTILLLVALFAIWGVADYLIFFYRHRAQLKLIPDTKLDWMIQVMEEAKGGDSSAENALNHSLTSRKELRSDLEDSIYGAFNPLLQMVGLMRVQPQCASEECVKRVQDDPSATIMDDEMEVTSVRLLDSRRSKTY